MRKLGLVFGLVVATLFSAASKADEVQYNLTGVFGPGTVSAPLSGPNGSFTMSFSLPQMPTPDYADPSFGDFAIFNVPVSYSFQCDGCSTPAPFSGLLDDADFATTGAGGMLAVELVTADGHDYYWEFSANQLFSGTVDQPTLISGGSTNLATSGQFELDELPFESVENVTLTATTVRTPEPGSRTLLIAALALLIAFACIKSKRA